MYFLAGKVVFLISESHSLKEKRMVIKSVNEKLRARFKVSVAETGEQDLWQKAEIGIVVVSGDVTFLKNLEHKMRDFIEDNYSVEIVIWDFEIIKK